MSGHDGVVALAWLEISGSAARGAVIGACSAPAGRSAGGSAAVAAGQVGGGGAVVQVVGRLQTPDHVGRTCRHGLTRNSSLIIINNHYWNCSYYF